MISEKIEARQLITLGADGVLVRGTYHEAPRKVQDGSNAQGKNIGVAFLNPLSTPRTLIGDSAVFWATSFAAQGYPSLRFDLPGLGDSFGETAKDLMTFINEAGFAAIASSRSENSQDFRPIRRSDLWALCGELRQFTRPLNARNVKVLSSLIPTSMRLTC